MENQFILRLPDTLLGIDPKDCSICKINQKEVNFTIKRNNLITNYPGIICRIPSIVESHKILDNKLYKIADLSTLIVIYEKKNFNFNLDEEILKIESCGLTPPMAYVKERRFEKNSVKSEEVEKIEKKVNELISEDSKAIKVEILNNDKESTDTDLDMLAAELENDFKIKDTVINDTSRQDSININTRIESVNNISRIENVNNNRVGKSNDIKKVVDVGLDMGSKDMPVVNPNEIDEIFNGNFNTNYSDQIHNEKISNDQQINYRQSDNEMVLMNHTAPEPASIPSSGENSIKSQELIALEIKIKEKQEQFDKAANPILKKRFEQVLNTLKEEYQKLLQK
jgi:TATA-binding protein-associated factor Taf7